MRLSLRFLVTALLLGLCASAAVAKQYPVHSVWSDNSPLGVIDGDTHVSHVATQSNFAGAWQESTPQGFAHAVATAGGSVYEFRLTSVSASDFDSVLGLWDVYRDDVLVCNQCVGQAYGLSSAVGNYFKIYVGTPTGYAELWGFAAFITNRFDY